MVSKKYENLNEDQWLLRYAHDFNSLSGEDGILARIFEKIGCSNRWCVEFGAWDGKKFSNSHHLMTTAEWNGVFIEADSERFKDLQNTYLGNPRAHCLRQFVTFAGDSSLDQLLAKTPIPKEFDLLSIDIDGADYHVWESLCAFAPRVVIIEFNPTIPSHLEFVQPRDMSVRQGSSLLSLVKLGKQKGYELACVTDYNAIFVQAPLFKGLQIMNNEVPRLRPRSEWEFHLFQLYDGTFVVGGPPAMPWQGLPIRQKDFQVLPRLLRYYPPPGRGLRRVIRWLWIQLYLRGII